MEDKEIVKALEEAIEYGCGHYREIEMPTIKNALDLINRLQAENERLKIENAKLRGYKTNDWLIRGISPEQLEHEKIQAWKAEAYKECIDMVKKKGVKVGVDEICIFESTLDNLLKELVGEDNASKNYQQPT